MQAMLSLWQRIFKNQFLRYIFIGGTTVAIDFGVLILLHQAIHINLLIAASLSYWLSILFNFLCNRAWTFDIRQLKNIHKHVFMYGLLLGVNYLFTITFMGISVHLGMQYIVAKLLSILIQLSWTYWIYKNFVFKT